eukprot:s134_g25.t1
MRSRAVGSQRSKLPCNQWICAGDPVRVDPQMPEAEVRVVASCPEDLHDQVMDICRELGMHKAFGKAGDFIDAIKSGAKWFDLWKAKVCQTVLVATMHSKCSVVKIVCIRGGPHCDEEFHATTDLVKAVEDDMMKQNRRKIEVVSQWMSMAYFEKNFCSEGKQEDPAEVAADEAAAAKHQHIFWAARAGDLPAVRGWVRRDPKNVEKKNEVAMTALHWAANRGHPAVVEFLISKNSDVHAVDVYGVTPLHGAASNRHVECVKLLLAAGANKNLKSNFGRTALDSAKEQGHDEIVRLLTADEDPAEVAADEAAAAKHDDIHRAARLGDLHAVRGFVRRDPGSVEEKDGKFRQTALHWAAAGGHPAVVEFLLSKKADVDAVDILSNTPLHHAALYGRMECVKLLRAAGARTDLKDIEGKTALDWAKENGHHEIVRLLEPQAVAGCVSIHMFVRGLHEKRKDRRRHLKFVDFWRNVPLKGVLR